MAELRRPQHGSVSAARRPAGLRQQPQRLPAAKTPFADPATLRHGRRRRQRRVHRPPQPRHGPAPDRPHGRPHPVQFAGVAGAAQLDPVGPVVHQPRRHALAAGHQRLRPRRRPQRLPLPDAALRRPHHRRGVLQPKQRRFGRLFRSCRRPSPRRRRLPGLRPRLPRRPAQPAAALRPFLQRQGQILPPAVQPGRHRIAHALRQQRRRPGRPVGVRQAGFAGRRQVHPPVRRPGRPPADRLDARPGQPPERSQIADARRRPLPHQVRQADRRPRTDATHQKRSEIQRTVAARPRPLQAHLRRRRAETAGAAGQRRHRCRRNCPRGRRSAWSVRPACTSARAIPTAPCPRAA